MNNSFARAWMILASVVLLISGFLALIVTAAKMPAVKMLVTDLDLVRWCLVVHVNLATLIWFTALPMGMLYLSAQVKGLARFSANAGFILAIIGILLTMSVPPQESVEIVLSNYIPVLAHPRYYCGIGIYLLGLVLSMLSPRFHQVQDEIKWPGLKECSFGLIVGSALLLLAIVALGEAFFELRSIKLISNKSLFEMGMWGGGHIIQHACIVFLLCVWVLLLSRQSGRAIFTRKELFPVFALLGLPVFVAPVLLRYAVTSNEYREGFSYLMRWGIAPPVLWFLFLTARRFPINLKQLKQYQSAAVALSAWLLVLGFIFGSMIRGSDMRVPGHYHATIGAVTLSFMTMAFAVLSQSTSAWMLRSIWSYGIGQSFFAGGMFVAGSFGMPRKTYGSEHILSNWGQSLGLGMMATGGLIAISGGIFFAFAIIPHLKLHYRKA